MRSLLTVFAVAGLMLALGLTAQAGSTWTVGPGKTYATIQSAIDNVLTVDGDMIDVYAGTYNETIVNGKNLTINGGLGGVTTIGPSGDVDYLFKATNATVTFKDFTVDGTGNKVKYGVFYDSGAGGEISGCAIQNIEWDIASAQGIRVIDSNPDIKSNTVQLFGRDGIYVRGSTATSTMLVDNNDVIGQGASLAADHLNKGIMIYGGASPTVQNNRIREMRTSTTGWANPGIEILSWNGTDYTGAGSDPLVQNNTIYDCNQGLLSGGGAADTSSPTIRANTFTDIGKGAAPSGVQALVVAYGTATVGGDTPADGNTLVFNSDTNKANVGIMLGADAGSGASVKNNTITGNGRLSYAGIDLQADGVTVSGNTITGANEGIVISASSDGAAISGGTLANNTYSGITYRGTGVTIKDSDFSGNFVAFENRGTGATIIQSDFSGHTVLMKNITDTGMVVKYNSFDGTNTWGFEQHFGSPIDAEYNWWGDPSGPGGTGPGSGDPIYQYGAGVVDYDPWASAQIPDVEGGSATITISNDWSGFGTGGLPGDLVGERVTLGDFDPDDTFLTLKAYYDPAAVSSEDLLRLYWYDTGASQWVLAGRNSNTDQITGEFVAGAATSNLGDWGVNTTGDYVWANIDHASDYGVAVPEPGTMTLLAVAGLGVLLRCRRKSI